MTNNVNIGKQVVKDINDDFANSTTEWFKAEEMQKHLRKAINWMRKASVYVNAEKSIQLRKMANRNLKWFDENYKENKNLEAKYNAYDEQKRSFYAINLLKEGYTIITTLGE